MLIVPYRSDVDRVERELLETCGALVGGSIGTFDDLFERVARDGGSRRPIATEAQLNLIVRGVVSGASLNGLGPSARFAGFAEALGGALRELEAGLVDPDELDGDLGRLYAAYRAELDRLGLWDRDLERRYAVERVSRGAGRVGRAPGLRVRVRGPDRHPVGTARRAGGPERRHGLAALRAWSGRVRLAERHDGRPRGARLGPDRGARTALRRGRAARAGPSRTPALLGAARRPARSSRARSASSRAPGSAARSSS